MQELFWNPRRRAGYRLARLSLQDNLTIDDDGNGGWHLIPERQRQVHPMIAHHRTNMLSRPAQRIAAVALQDARAHRAFGAPRLVGEKVDRACRQRLAVDYDSARHRSERQPRRLAATSDSQHDHRRDRGPAELTNIFPKTAQRGNCRRGNRPARRLEKSHDKPLFPHPTVNQTVTEQKPPHEKTA